MLLVFGFLPKQAQPCNGSRPQKSEWITKQVEVQERDEQEEMARVKGVNETEAEGLSHLQMMERKSDQELSGSLIHKEERVLRLMKEQEIPARSGKVYRFIPAERNDTVKNTCHAKYLPVEICGDNEANCDIII